MDETLTVAHIMTTSVVVAERSTPVGEVARLMCANAITGIPVVEDERVVGIVTEVDIVSRQIDVDPPAYGTFLDAIFRLPWDRSDDEIRRVLATNAGELMTTPVKTIRADASIQDAANLMFKRKVNPVPVVSTDGKLIGIISRSDIVRLMVEE